MYKVYVKTDDTGRIVSVNSDAFMSSTDGWAQTIVGAGHGDVGDAPEPLANWLEDATETLAAIQGILTENER